MNFIDKEIERYCTDMSSVPSPICEEIAEYTRQNVDMSVMLSGPLVGSLLGFLVRTIRAKCVLEIGTYTGYSALVMAEQLPPDGSLITLDQNPKTMEIAQGFWAKSPAGLRIKAITGDAKQSLKQLNGPFDFVFIDADKSGYPHYVERSLEMLSPHGLIVVDNALFSGEVLNPTEKGPAAIRQMTEAVHKDNSLHSSLLPIRDGLLLIQKRAGV